MAGLLGVHRNRYTLERLKYLYSDLLQAVDVSKEELGRRGGIDEDWDSGEEDDGPAKETTSDATTTTTKSSLLSLDGLRRTLAILPLMHRRRRRRRRSPVKRRARRTSPEELQAAFRFLAATKSPDKEGDNGGATAWRDDEIVSALREANYIEKMVVRIIKQIGEVVANGEKPSSASSASTKTLACDPCFEYFCEKNILHLLVDIAKQNGTNKTHHRVAAAHHGVVWGAMVKAQVLQTVSLLVASGARKKHFLYYILSQNSINELLACMLPLTLWTDPALEKIMPAFVDLLKNLGLQLAGSPDLFPFFASQESFPLLHAALEIGTSSYAQTDSFVHITCLSIIVNTMKITPIHNAWVSTAVPEMQKLCGHLSQLLLNRYHRIADLSTGPIVDGLRCNAVGAQLVTLHDQISVLNDVLSCGVPGLNVRLCEELIRRVVLVVLKNLEPPKERAFLHVGVSDLDVIPHRECLAQVSMVFLAQLFQRIDYLPFVRMLAVALFHPKSASSIIKYDPMSTQTSSDKGKEDYYIFVPALDAIAQGKLLKDADVVDNPFRIAFLRTLRGDFGDWRFPAAAIVVETVLSSDDFDLETLQILDIVPRVNCESDDEAGSNRTEKEEKNADEKDANYHLYEYKPTGFEDSLTSFLKNRSCALLTSVLKTCLECAGSLALALYFKSTMAVIRYGYDCGKCKAIRFPDGSNRAPLRTAILNAKTSFCERALESQKCLGVSDIFLELVETAVVDRYKRVASSTFCGRQGPPSPTSTYACHLSQIGCVPVASSPDLLVRKFRCVKCTDVETARFHIEMAIHFRSLSNVLEQFCDKMEIAAGGTSSSVLHTNVDNRGNKTENMALDLIEVADDFAITFGGLSDRPNVSADLDLRGRMTFPCFLSTGGSSQTSVLNLAEDVILRHSATLVLVVDPTDVFVAKPNPKSGVDRGTIVCRVALQSVIAAASDGERLHIAVRHPDVGRLIKNGNMVLQFENAGTCLIVRQYLDRCRNTIRRELNERFRFFMEPDTAQTSNVVQLEGTGANPMDTKGEEITEPPAAVDDRPDVAPC